MTGTLTSTDTSVFTSTPSWTSTDTLTTTSTATATDTWTDTATASETWTSDIEPERYTHLYDPYPDGFSTSTSTVTPDLHGYLHRESDGDGFLYRYVHADGGGLRGGLHLQSVSEPCPDRRGG
jgi:hypothetical protein